MEVVAEGVETESDAVELYQIAGLCFRPSDKRDRSAQAGRRGNRRRVVNHEHARIVDSASVETQASPAVLNIWRQFSAGADAWCKIQGIMRRFLNRAVWDASR
jgi:hypothetical protein